jgi:cytochrome d ubiquinol oxidase subunit I
MANDLLRWQFATTTIYHFFFPVTIGLAFLVAVLQTAWYRTDNPDYKRMTRFVGTLLLINVAIGVVTGRSRRRKRAGGKPGARNGDGHPTRR